ncbi:hypothetical protein EYF80_043841 [Liparis tanakae]|uniref:Uncharacterized protein n=1 Tax=Liparis tanakae TaxID=230148 RepID=A0A4Z2FYI2_9TELE|nr:hypothetical protein EYF80_043841 [Liparis tanakae]
MVFGFQIIPTFPHEYLELFLNSQWDAQLQHNNEHNARWRPVEISSHPEREKICKMQIIFREFIKV